MHSMNVIPYLFWIVNQIKLQILRDFKGDYSDKGLDHVQLTFRPKVFWY